MPKIAVILSGCGYLDGAEIRESVLTLLYLDKAGATVQMFAPNKQQHHVVDHLSQDEEEDAPRNVLHESARIARGNIDDLSLLDMEQYDGLIMPGGFGVAKNLSTFAFEGTAATIDGNVKKAITDTVRLKKPLGAICIAPVIVAASLSPHAHPTLTIGDDEQTATAIEGWGCTHKQASTAEMVYDPTLKIATCSAYMRDDASLADVATGIEKVVQQVLADCNSHP